MATNEARGSKRTCQNPECGSRFYDLNRDPIICPICDTVYKLAPVVVEDEPEEVVESAETAAAADAPAAAATATAANGLDAGDGEEVTDDDALVSLEDADAELEGDSSTSSDDEDDTFLEEEDDEGSDVTGIIGNVAEDDEET